MTEAVDLRVGLDVRGLRVLVVGGSGAALRRVGALRAAGAAVTVVAGTVVAAIEDLAHRRQLDWLPRDYTPSDLDGAWLVMTCTGRPLIDAAVAADARKRRIFCVGAEDDSRSKPPQSAAHRDEKQPVPRGGRVVLVGGGPGDPGLITVKGMRALAEADVIVVDRLAPLAVLDGLPEGVEIIDVSKVPRGRFTPQDQINDILIDRARRGRTVIRLKGGDPYVFGRGMEESQACAAAGVPVDVVPGVTSAISVPALAGIPVTHRGISQGFTVVSGHVPPGDRRSTLNWGALARSGTTLVILMGVETLPATVATLLAQGRAVGTPLACMMDGGLTTQRVVASTLGQVAASGVPAGLQPPAVVVIGEVVKLTTAPVVR